MAAAKHSENDEAAFMKDLLAGLDDSFFDAVPSPDPSPRKKQKHASATVYATPTKPKHTTVHKGSPLVDRRIKKESSGLSVDPDVSQTETLVGTLSANNSMTDCDITMLLDGMEDCDWDDMHDFLSPKKKTPKREKMKEKDEFPVLQPPPYVPPECTRCTVESVDTTSHQFQKILVVLTYPDKERHAVILKDVWTTTDVRKGDTINIIGRFDTTHTTTLLPTCAISSASNLLILHPDTLLTATSIANTSQCLRKPMLSSFVRSSTDITPALVWGNMLHEIMQRCLSEGDWSSEYLEECVEEAVMKGLPSLVRLDVGIEDARKELRRRAEAVRAFGERFVGRTPKSAAILSGTRDNSRNHGKNKKITARLAVAELHDTEEDIWSPMYGLKGKLDASIQAIVEEEEENASAASQRSASMNRTGAGAMFNANSANSLTRTSYTLPFEIKTGRAPMSLSGAGTEHRAQTMLYALLMGERYVTRVEEGLLFYLGGGGGGGGGGDNGANGAPVTCSPGEVWRVRTGWNEVRGLIMARNEVVSWNARRELGGRDKATGRGRGDGGVEDVKKKGVEMRVEDDIEEPFLPPTVDDRRVCGRCYVVDTCMLYRKAVENVTDTTSPISDIYAQKTAHLTPAHAAFFRKWERMISIEEEDAGRWRREMWIMGSREREERGRCVGGLVVAEVADKSDAVNERIGQFVHRFVRRGAQGRSILGGAMMVGDPVVLSVDWECFESSSTPTSQGDSLTPSLKQNVKRFEYPRLLALARGYVLEMTSDAIVVGLDHRVDDAYVKKRMGESSDCHIGQDVVYRLDKDELTGGVARIRDNLAQMFYVGGSRRRLELIVDLKPPVFDTEAPKLVEVPTRTQTTSANAASSTTQLNTNQLQALTHVLRAQDYALVLGMPGTGKTTTVAEVIRVLVGLGKTVLLTSYTHSAVDTILRKLVGGGGEEDKADEVGVLRLGNVDKVHPDIRPYTLSALDKAASVEQLERQLMRPPVVATTCLSIDHEVFSRRRFDYCIVDEASQTTLPTCVGPLRFADKFVLVGDHFQLPPLVKSPAARKAGLDVSLFRLLSDAHPHAVIDLAYQYRMNAEIMLLSNRLIYGGRLKCGSKEVAERCLKVPKRALAHAPGRCGAHEGVRCWLDQLLDESAKAVFVNTDNLPAQESREGDLTQNLAEARLISHFVRALVRGGVSQKDIGVLSLYRQQIKVLSGMLSSGEGGLCADVEVLTADRSQGRDKEVVVISMVRSNDGSQIGELLKDWRRINVAFTRAKSKLVIFGSRKTLQASPVMKEFFELMDEQGWVLDLMKGADAWHSSYDISANEDGGVVFKTEPVSEEDMEVLTPCGKKRALISSEVVSKGEDVDQMCSGPARKVKKAKTSTEAQDAFVKHRPILRDIFNDAK